jgi:hypothetical protein
MTHVLRDSNLKSFRAPMQSQDSQLDCDYEHHDTHYYSPSQLHGHQLDRDLNVGAAAFKLSPHWLGLLIRLGVTVTVTVDMLIHCGSPSLLPLPSTSESTGTHSGSGRWLPQAQAGPASGWPARRPEPVGATDRATVTARVVGVTVTVTVRVTDTEYHTVYSHSSNQFERGPARGLFYRDSGRQAGVTVGNSRLMPAVTRIMIRLGP